MNMHEVAYNAVQRIMEQIRPSFREFLQKVTPHFGKDDMLRPFNTEFSLFPPYNSFKIRHEWLEQEFLTLMNSYGMLFGSSEEQRFADLLRDEVKAMVMEHLEYLEEVEKREGQRVLMAESLAEIA